MKKLQIKEHNLLATSRLEEKFTYNEMRLFLYVLSFVNNTDKEFPFVKISLNDLKNFYKTEGRTLYELRDKIANKLISKNIRIENNKELILHSLYETIKIDKETNDFHIKIDHALKPYLIGLKGNFFIYYLNNLVKLKSINLIKFYRYLCKILPSDKDFKKLKISLGKLKKDLDLETKYFDFRRFKTAILNKAQKEITSKTDLDFNYDLIRDPNDLRRVQYIVLKVSRKNSKTENKKPIWKKEEEEREKEREKIREEQRKRGIK